MFRGASRRSNSEPDDGVIFANGRHRSGFDPFGAPLESGVEQHLVEGAAQYVPSIVGDLVLVLVAPDERDPELVFPIRAIENSAVFQRIILRFDRRPKPEFSQCELRRASQRFTDMIAWERFSLDDDRLDATSQ